MAGNIIIIGGGLFNKGAQAMTFTTVDQIKRRYPNKNIYLFSTRDFEREEKEKALYKFNILPWNLNIKIKLLCFRGNLFKKIVKYGYLENNIRKIIKDTDFFIDISGYALSSQLGSFPSYSYLLNIMVAKKYSVPYYIFPQSIGPFNYPLKHKIFLYPLMKLYLKYPKKIFIREREGLMWVHKFTKENIKKSHDIVLQNKEYDLANIYNRGIHFREIMIEPNSVGIIPNSRIIARVNSNEIYLIYKSLIDGLLNAKKKVYILRHSYHDLEVCKTIKKFFPNNKSVKLISDDLNVIELENIIKQFDFVIASRYHSIIHSYKNGIPALVIGWATKYFELLENFNQLDYFFDSRSHIEINEINNKLEKMIRNYKHERENIVNKMIVINKRNIFDLIF